LTPAFLSTDWFRASHYQTTPLQYFPYLYVSGSNTHYYPLYYPNPPGNVKSYAAWVSQNMVGLGFSVQANSIMFNIAATDMTGCGITPTENIAGTVSGIVTNQFPMTIPIIDGSMYD
jgi:hypothetical protein